MEYPVNVLFSMRRGSTFTRVLRWEVPPAVYRPITAMVSTAPCTLTVANHGLVEGWRAAIADVRGATPLNAKRNPPELMDYRQVTVVNANTLQFNTVDADSYPPYESGGYIRYNTPVDMAGMIARLHIREKVTSDTTIAQLTTENGGIVLDNVTKKITITIAAAVTALFIFKSAVYDMEVESSGGIVTPLIYGNISLNPEVTR